MAIDWAHMEKAPKQNYQRGIRLESTRPENTRETTTLFEKDKNERRVRWRATAVALCSTRNEGDLLSK